MNVTIHPCADITLFFLFDLFLFNQIMQLTDWMSVFSIQHCWGFGVTWRVVDCLTKGRIPQLWTHDTSNIAVKRPWNASPFPTLPPRNHLETHPFTLPLSDTKCKQSNQGIPRAHTNTPTQSHTTHQFTYTTTQKQADISIAASTTINASSTTVTTLIPFPFGSWAVALEGRGQENTCTNARHILNDLRLNQVERMATAFQLNTNIRENFHNGSEIG